MRRIALIVEPYHKELIKKISCRLEEVKNSEEIVFYVSKKQDAESLGLEMNYAALIESWNKWLVESISISDEHLYLKNRFVKDKGISRFKQTSIKLGFEKPRFNRKMLKR